MISLLLEQNTIKKGRIDKSQSKLKKDNSKEYKIKIIWDSMIYASKSEVHLPSLYYFVL